MCQQLHHRHSHPRSLSFTTWCTLKTGFEVVCFIQSIKILIIAHFATWLWGVLNKLERNKFWLYHDHDGCMENILKRKNHTHKIFTRGMLITHIQSSKNENLCYAVWRRRFSWNVIYKSSLNTNTRTHTRNASVCSLWGAIFAMSLITVETALASRVPSLSSIDSIVGWEFGTDNEWVIFQFRQCFVLGQMGIVVSSRGI